MLLTGFGLGCLLPLFVITLRDFRHLLVGQLFLIVIIASVAFLIDPLMPLQWRWITSDLQTALPCLFWFLCQLIFAPRLRLKSVWAAMAIYSFLAPALARPFVVSDGSWTLDVFLGWRLGQFFEYVVVLHGLSLVIRYWRNDLVEARRKARLAFLLIVGSAVGVATVSLNFGLYHEYIRGIITGLAAFTTLTCLVTSREGILELVGSRADAELPREQCSRAPETDQKSVIPAQQEMDSEVLGRVMASGFYRTEKLTLKKLSEATDIPEYRLRKVINQTLGYRNFNDYINQLRVADAAARLRLEPETPVLNISLDVGYRTLSSFNRAFRDIQNTTPTEFRQQCPEPEVR
ncbi:helix-turn-helix domain-containing protein [Marinobacter sp. F3R08]|uniref:helix-turn-helix domain-containing protein n=1 Tax=Marinobacter sp. F3R08 TaxID=2841559 RepID=UPI001C09157B|nr:AraC family transcriptional regulator [Marinobacter sp. F3R08]MBU2953713.1 AraC family transcriptional regulator [Marinobacter sp. F3R08]